MKRALWTAVVLASLAGAARAEDGRFAVVQGQVPSTDGKAGAVPVLIKVDSDTGDTWRLVPSGGTYWWIPVKNGVVADKKPAAAPAEPPVPAAQ